MVRSNSRHANSELRQMIQVLTSLESSILKYVFAVDTYYHTLLGAFEDDDVTHVEGDVNPVRDLDIISEELRLKDVDFSNAHLEKLEKLVVRGNDKKLKPEYVSTQIIYFSKITFE